MQVNSTAPVVVRREIDVEASARVIWGVLTGFGRWPEWNPDVKSLTIEGVVQEGTEFHWKTGASTINSTIRSVDEPRSIGWTGKTFGVSAAHVYELRPEGDGTVVTSEESWDGPLVSLLRAPIRKMLAKSLSGGLRHLKSEAERQASL